MRSASLNKCFKMPLGRCPAYTFAGIFFTRLFTIQMKISNLLTVVLFFLPATFFAQGFPQPSDAPARFDEIRQRFDDHWGGVVPPKGHGYPVFKRWEWFWSTRLLPDGTLPPADINQVEWQAYLDKHPEAAAADNTPANWTSMGPTTSNSGYFGLGRINCMAFHPTNSSIFWAGAPAGGLWKTTNGGSNWTPLTDQLASIGVSAIAVDPTNTNTIYIATGDKDAGATQSVGVLKTTNGGASWSSTALSFTTNQYKRIQHLVINPVTPSVLLAATSDGLYRTANGGASWTLTLSGTTVFDVVFKPGDPNTVYAATGASIYRSTNGGQSWTAMYTIPNSTRIALAVTPANAAVVAAVSCAGDPFNGLYLSNNSGQSFTLQSSAPNLLNHEASGSGGGGFGWYTLCVAISPTNASTIFVGGVNLWRSTNGGVSWTLINFWNGAAPAGVAEVHADKHYLGWRDNTTLFQGNDGGIYYSQNNGASWTDVSNTLAVSQMYRVGVSQSDEKVISGLQDNGTKLRSTGGAWTDHIGGDGMDCAIHPTNSNVMYAELQGGILHVSTNGGAGWTNIRNNIPGQPEGAWVTPIALRPNGTLYAAYNDVYKTTNQGTSWTAISTNLSANKLTLLAVAPSNSDYIYAGTEYQLWRTTNGGGGWIVVNANLPASPITSITVDPANPDRVYATIGGYASGQKVYRSTNGGDTWTNISGTLPNLPANCLVYQPGSNEALYLGTDVGVFYRTAAMTDWVAYSTGLPRAPVLDLELRTSTNTLRAATFGRGLWQSPAESTTSTTLLVTPATQNVGAAAGATTFTVTSNLSWTVTDNAAWLTVSPTSGSNNGTLTASYQANTSTSPRTATITVTAGTLSQTVTVVQAGTTGGGTCTDDNEPVNNNRLTAPYIAAGTPKLSLLGYAGDFDYWKFTLSTAQSITATLSTLPADFELQIQDQAGNMLGSSTNSSTNSESIALTLSAGTYYAYVYGYLNAYSASQCYTLSVTAGGGGGGTCTNDSEPANNAIATAPAIAFATDKWSQIGSATDHDYYKFTLTQNSVAIVRLQNLPADYNLLLYNGSGTLIASSTNTGTANEGLETELAPGSYYARVVSAAGAFSTSQCYKIRVSVAVLGACTNADEPANNNLATAPLRTLNAYTYSQLGAPGDQDYWKFTVPVAGPVYLDLFNLPADYELRLLNSAGAQLAQSVNGNNSSEFISLNVAAGTYYAHVYGYNSAYSTSVCYTLEIANSNWLPVPAALSEGPGDEASAVAEPAAGLRLVPNPTTGRFDVLLDEPGAAQLTIVDARGRLVRSDYLEARLSLDLSGEPDGVYQVMVVQNGRLKQGRIVLLGAGR